MRPARPVFAIAFVATAFALFVAIRVVGSFHQSANRGLRAVARLSAILRDRRPDIRLRGFAGCRIDALGMHFRTSLLRSGDEVDVPWSAVDGVRSGRWRESSSRTLSVVEFRIRASGAWHAISMAKNPSRLGLSAESETERLCTEVSRLLVGEAA